MKKIFVDDYIDYDISFWIKRLNIEKNNFSTPPKIIARDNKNFILQIIKNELGFIVIIEPEFKNVFEKYSSDINWSKNIKKRTFLNKLKKILYLQNKHGIHNVGLACDINTFCPVSYNNKSIKVKKVKPGDKYWNNPDEKETERPFKYLIFKEDKDIAQAGVKKNINVLNGNIWSISVGVRKNYRNKGFGKIVTSAIVEDIVKMGGVALWNTNINNIASLSIAESLGFKTFFYYIRINK
jgi:hypothetical protein